MDKVAAKETDLPIPIETVLACIPESIFLMNRNLDFIYANTAYLKMVDLRAKDVLGRNKLEVFPESVNTKFYSAYLRVLETGTSETVVDYYPPMDRAFESRITSVPGGLAVIVVEVTERIKEELRRTEESRLLALALNLANTAPWNWDFVKDEVQCAIDFLPESFLNVSATDWISLVHPGDVSIVSDHFLTLKAQPREAEIAYRLAIPGHGTRHVRQRVFPNAELSGEIRRVEGVLIDETEAKLAQEAAEDSHEIRRLALHAARAGSWDYDIATQTADWSSDFEAVVGVGLSDEKSVGAFAEIVFEDDRRAFLDAAGQCIETGDDLDVTFRICHPREGIRWINSRGKILNSSGREHMVGISIDVTEIVESAARIDELNTKLQGVNQDLEERVDERTALLKAANDELEAFCYTVSHDLRAPLRSIFGYSRILQSDYSSVLDERGQHYLDRQQKSAVRLSTLIDDILQFSRLGRHHMEPREVNLSSLVFEVGDEMLDREEKTTSKLEVQPGLKAYGDPRLIRLIFQNLIDNSLKFGRPGEPVVILIGEQETDRGLAIYVKDNGVGIDMQYASRLFMPFERLHTQQEFPGNGIGLANVRRCVEQHEGLIWVESELNVGTTFYIQLPRKAAPTAASQ